MLSLKECRELIDDPKLSREEILKIRDACYELADIALDHIEALREETRSAETFGKEPGMQGEISLDE